MTPRASAIVDEDANGWSDLWEIAYGSGYVLDADDDGDGRTNWEEHQDGTDPIDADSIQPPPTVLEKPKGTWLISWPTVQGKSYQLQLAVDGGEWQSLGAPKLGTGDLISLKLPKTTTRFTDGPLFSRWLNVNGGTVAPIKTRVTNGTPPNQTGVLPIVETPQTSPNISNYGQWIRGWIIPPAAGKYTFYVASDDNSELWLSPTDDPAGKVLIAGLGGTYPKAGGGNKTTGGYSPYRVWTTYESQTSDPQTLKAGKPVYFEIWHKEGGSGDYLSVGWSGPKLNGIEIIGSKYVFTDPKTLAEKLGPKGVPTWRVVVSDVDSDNDGLNDYEEGLAGFDPLNATTIPRVADLTSLHNARATASTVTVGAEKSRGYELQGDPVRFTFTRSGGINPLEIKFSISGEATAGEDFETTAGTVFLPIGHTSVSVDVVPTKDGQIESAEKLTTTVEPNDGYVVGSPSSATATFDDAADIIYLANLAGTATKSGGYGTAALRVVGNQLFANFSLSYGNLTAPHVATEIYILGPGSRTTPVWTIEPGQISTKRWEFEGVTGATREAILVALKAGKLYCRLTTSRFELGELTGKFTPYSASAKPPTPPSGGSTLTKARNDGEAARFLTQATFGPTVEDIAKVKKAGFSAWITDQIKQPPTLHLPYVQARRAELIARDGGDGWQMPRQEAWWQAALTAPDQLRQRVAFALSEILVVSDVGVLDGSHEGITNYYDMLVKNAFGNFRTILEEVTLSPIMGQYLSMVRNQKPNPATNSEPDENYAREVMQLFSVGLSMLNTDGSLKLNSEGMPIPTYTQADTVGLAHVFTGWGYAYDPAAPPANLRNYFLYGEREEMNRMMMFPEFHDLKAKKILNGVTIPAGQTGEQDLKIALDTLFDHPNVGPFIARQLIQRLVTSNPSRGYIYRVATVFNKSKRGDLGATVRAILTDPEARNPANPLPQGYGKLREPVLRVAHLLRAHKATPPKTGDTRFFLDQQYSMPYQAALKSGSVFNFFQPGFIQPGPIAKAGLFAPEFQITSETSVITQTNLNFSALFWGGIWTPEGTVRFDYSRELAILKTPDKTPVENQNALLDHLNVLLLNGQMSVGLRTALLNAYATLPTWFNSTDNYLTQRVQMAIWLITSSPEYCIQK